MGREEGREGATAAPCFSPRLWWFCCRDGFEPGEVISRQRAAGRVGLPRFFMRGENDVRGAVHSQRGLDFTSAPTSGRQLLGQKHCVSLAAAAAGAAGVEAAAAKS